VSKLFLSFYKQKNAKTKRKQMPAQQTSKTQHIDPRVLAYEQFINEVLRTELNKVLEERDKIYERIAK